MGLLIIQWKAKNYPSLLWLDLEMKKPENCQSKLWKMMKLDFGVPIFGRNLEP